MMPHSASGEELEKDKEELSPDGTLNSSADKELMATFGELLKLTSTACKPIVNGTVRQRDRFVEATALRSDNSKAKFKPLGTSFPGRYHGRESCSHPLGCVACRFAYFVLLWCLLVYLVNPNPKAFALHLLWSVSRVRMMIQT
jgi:hypothetical protein